MRFMFKMSKYKTLSLLKSRKIISRKKIFNRTQSATITSVKLKIKHFVTNSVLDLSSDHH